MELIKPDVKGTKSITIEGPKPLIHKFAIKGKQEQRDTQNQIIEETKQLKLVPRPLFAFVSPEIVSTEDCGCVGCLATKCRVCREVIDSFLRSNA